MSEIAKKFNNIMSLQKIIDIFKFELCLSKKKHLVMLTLSSVLYNIFAILMIFLRPETPQEFAAASLSQLGSFLSLLTLFFAGGIIADEFDKRTALTNFTKAGRNNFFIGKTLAAYTSVFSWIGIPFVETIIFTAIIYLYIPIELFIWFGYYCIVGLMYVALYLFFSAMFRSGSQAMSMGFLAFIALASAFGICGAFLNAWTYFPIYAEVVGQSIFFNVSSESGGIPISIRAAIIMLLAYMIPSYILAYLRFKSRDV